MQDPDLGFAAFRALQLMQFTTPLLLDEDGDLAAGLRRVKGLDALATVGRIDDRDVVRAYEADRALARTAEGSPTAFLGKAAVTDGPVRYTAPSMVFEHDGERLEAGGFQPLEAYEVIIANLDPTLNRRSAPATPLAALEEAPWGLATAEVAEIMRRSPHPADRDAAEEALIEAAAHGDVVRVPTGDDAIWLAGRYADEGPRFVRASPIAASSGVTPSVAASATTGACRAVASSSSITPPSAQGTRTSTGAISAFSGVAQRAPSRAASARLARSMSETTSRVPRRASSRATRNPTCPSPTTAADRPFSEAVPSARSTEASTAVSTPSAVNGLGSPEPPRERASPETCAVPSAITVMSRAEVPTSSAVM